MSHFTTNISPLAVLLVFSIAFMLFEALRRLLNPPPSRSVNWMCLSLAFFIAAYAVYIGAL